MESTIVSQLYPTFLSQKSYLAINRDGNVPSDLLMFLSPLGASEFLALFLNTDKTPTHPIFKSECVI